LYGRIKSVQPHTALKRVIATSIKEYLPLLQSFLFTLIKERKGGTAFGCMPRIFG
jgi:long-chain acyl-CoA synthetase